MSQCEAVLRSSLQIYKKEGDDKLKKKLCGGEVNIDLDFKGDPTKTNCCVWKFWMVVGD